MDYDEKCSIKRDARKELKKKILAIIATWAMEDREYDIFDVYDLIEKMED